MLRTGLVAFAGLALLAGGASAEVKAKAKDGATFQFKGEVAMARPAAWARLLDVGKWWSDGHTYSGKALSMTVKAEAGGCWCEIWAGGEVEHGRVISLMNNELLRFSTALGPLQGTGVNAAMTWTLADGSKPGTTAVTMDYVVVGSSLSALDQMAAPVDGVLKEQFDKFVAGK